jgi:hypothetical protein
VKQPAHKRPRPFLGVEFTDCGVYGRLYRNGAGTAYEGRCPRCGARCRIRIGAGGTQTRFFKTRCH